MATPKTTKRTTTRKKASTTSRSNTAAKKPAKKTAKELEHHYKVTYELKIIALVAFTLFTMLSLYTSTVGQFGHAIKNIYLGLCSYVGFILPVFIFIYIFVHINMNFRPARNRIYIAMSLILLGAMLLTTMMVFSGVERELFKVDSNFGTAQQYKVTFDRSVLLKGGGVMGELVTFGVLKLIGNIGAFILIIVSFVSGFIVWTRISLHDLWDEKRKKQLEKKQIKQEELARLMEARATAAAARPETVSKPQKASPLKEASQHTIEADSEHFLNTLDTFRKASRKKDVKAFDYDSYDNADKQKVQANEAKVETKIEPKLEMNSAVTSTGKVTPTPIMPQPVHHSAPELVMSGVKSIFKGGSKLEPEMEPNGAYSSEPVIESKATENVTTAESPLNMSPQPEVQDKKVVKIKEKDIEPEVRQNVHDEIKENIAKPVEHYVLPPITLLNENKNAKLLDNQEEYIEMAKLLEETLVNFNVEAKVVSVKRGPSITMFEVQLSPGVKVSKIVGLSEDIALNLATSHVRIAPIPGKAAIGIEVPNKVTSMVTIKEVLNSPEFKKQTSKITIGLGKDISGNAIVGDLASMPHLLIAGATGSGKSVCINTIISSILFNARPDEVKFLMIDPKVVELSTYNGIPHLILPVVTDPKKASIALNWAVNEMTRRYKLFAEQTVRDMKGYNKKAELQGIELLPQIVVIIDELADLMMVAPNQVEDAICRLAQMARAAGIHLIVATQRPSVDVITGLIKANIPSRIAFSVSSSIDSRTIIDMGGAEKLLGKGDMLFYPVGAAKPKRTQGAFMSDEEVEGVVDFIKNQSLEVSYNEAILDEVQSVEQDFDEADEYLEEAIRVVLDSGLASASMMQRKFRVGYNRAARMIDSMEERGIIGPSRGSKPREVLMTLAEFDSMCDVSELEGVSSHKTIISSEDDFDYDRSSDDAIYDEDLIEEEGILHSEV
ncbi:DNA translocase FtsK [Fusibacter sp. 3D3]|uniref:FtsK/SpoIIIE family DNA translocase n=1 Tax=Fusibacter sp. 3D3 TaxID=1048380 RepID=UPI000852D10B|nr:DNA translocase FtsK [Fusibacter sp. 3D3]GAU79099.1 cell division protein FtsK [Fusibacter sp. 3D3]